MPFSRRATGKLRMESAKNNRIREIIKVKHTIMGDIEEKQLIFSRHLEIITDGENLKESIQWNQEEEESTEGPEEAA